MVVAAMRDEGEEGRRRAVVAIRDYDPKTDRDGTEAVERECEVGPAAAAGGMSLHADLLGDPVARIRHSPHYLMLVAETSGPDGRIVALVRGTVKSVASGKSRPGAPAFARVGYILGLRVAPSHRRMGIARQLVHRLEQWFELMGAEYAYMATDRSNEASLRLFTGRCGYSKFRTPSLLVHPVHSHRLRAPRRATVVRLGARDAERLYLSRLAHVEFFPADIGAVLGNALSRGTFLATVGGRAAAVAVEVAAMDPLRGRIPHWRRLSCTEDLWCMKRLGAGGGGHADGWDWARSAPGRSIFVDPREV